MITWLTLSYDLTYPVFSKAYIYAFCDFILCCLHRYLCFRMSNATCHIYTNVTTLTLKDVTPCPPVVRSFMLHQINHLSVEELLQHVLELKFELLELGFKFDHEPYENQCELLVDIQWLTMIKMGYVRQVCSKCSKWIGYFIKLLY